MNLDSIIVHFQHLQMINYKNTNLNDSQTLALLYYCNIYI